MTEVDMKHGMLWYDSRTDGDMVAQVKRAVEYFTAKYGCRPTHCYVHPDMLVPDFSDSQGIQIVPSLRVLRNHIWIEFPLVN